MNINGTSACHASNLIIIFYLKAPVISSGSRDRIVVSTLRCGRHNPGSNPGHGTSCFNMIIIFWSLFSINFFFIYFKLQLCLLSFRFLMSCFLVLSSVFSIFLPCTAFNFRL